MSHRRKEMEAQLLSITKEFLREMEAERALQAVTLDASLERDLGIDSLGKVELFHRIEKIFSIRLSENAMIKAESLDDLVDIIETSTSISPAKISSQTFAPILETSSLDMKNTQTLMDALMIHATKEPKRPHLYLQNEQGKEEIISYDQLLSEAKKIASGLHRKGIQFGETVAIMLPTSKEFFYSFCGVWLAGAIPVPIYPPFRPERIEEYAKRESKILANAEARMLITFARAEILSNILRTFVPSLREVTTIKHLKGEENALPELQIETHDYALIQYTSGSTGDPKGVLLTHQNILANIRAIGEAIPVKASDVCVSWLPLYHDMGLLTWLSSLYFGMPVTILSPITFLTRPEKWLWTIHYHRGTLSGGPNFAYELCVKKINSSDIEGLDLSSWRFAFNGAEAIHPKTLEHFYQKFSPYGFRLYAFAPVYGLAETTVGLTFPKERREPHIDKISRDLFEKDNKAIPSTAIDALQFVACGEPLPKHLVRIVDDQQNNVSDRVIGNIQFSGPSAMQGYFNHPEATRKIYHDGWWDTGDLGYLAEKELYITGRKKDLIIKAGRNLYPAEVEEIVGVIPNIRKGCVVAFSVQDDRTGTEKLIVVAETYEFDKKKQQNIRKDIIEKMAIELGIPPDHVILVSPKTVPKTSSGKLQRSACKELYLKGKLFHQPLPVKMQLIKLSLESISRKIWHGMQNIEKFLYTFYIGILLFVTLPWIWILVFLLSHDKAAKITKIWARFIFLLAACPIRMEGKENLKKSSPIIFVANHASYIDSLLLMAILPAGVIFTPKQEVLQSPIIKTFVKKLRYVTIDRLDFLKSLENKKRIEEILRNKESVVIFPEGTFTYATGLRPFKLGAFTVAAETGVPLCPIAIFGTRTILRGESYFLKPGKIKVTVGNLFYPKVNDWNEVLRLHTQTRTEIAKHCGEPVIDLVVAGIRGID